jgi:short subunit dehydrogenase-like uncharacterized protein
MADEQREFDIVLYGATGFVGKLVAAYLAQRGGGARLALAGRSVDKLKALRDSLGEAAGQWGVIAADAGDPTTLEAMANRTRVVMTSVGPFGLYGLPLVAACATAGTDYVDVTGETPFVRQSIIGYDQVAKNNGARIVHSCGFDSLPSDLSVHLLHRRVRDDGAGELGDTNLVVQRFDGGMSGGTIASALNTMREVSADADLRRAIDDPYTLSPRRSDEPSLGPQPDLQFRRGRDVAPELGSVWTGGFMLAAHDVRIVRRSNALLDWAYGRSFRYGESQAAGTTAGAPVSALLSTYGQRAVFGLASRYARLLPESLMDRVAPKPGTGPSEADRDKGGYRLETYTTTTTGARYRATVSQEGDPGYKSTALLFGESGLALALDGDRLDDHHGVLTPAVALGDVLVERLSAAGVAMSVEKLGTGHASS